VLSVICDCKPEYLPSFQTRLLITFCEVLMAPSLRIGKLISEGDLNKGRLLKLKNEPLYTRILIPASPKISFPVTKFSLPPRALQNRYSDSNSPTVPPTRYQRERARQIVEQNEHKETLLPPNVNSNTEICIACLINYNRSIGQTIEKRGFSYASISDMKFQSFTPKLCDVRCHLLHSEPVCIGVVHTLNEPWAAKETFGKTDVSVPVDVATPSTLSCPCSACSPVPKVLRFHFMHFFFCYSDFSSNCVG
jgi:hypothetical protein